MFAPDSVPAESKKVIENFDKIVSEVRNLSGKQKVSLFGAIKNLSHLLTSERSARRVGYMNDAGYISAYISYFMWWNLVRMTRLFSNLPAKTFEPLLKTENPIALDVGSGTLTVVIALWLARPELREKKIKWYCMDLSQTALAAGENLYFSIAAKTIKENESPWEIVRVKGAFGTSIKEKTDFVTCANVFNEILQRNELPTDFLAKKYTSEILSYSKDDENSLILLIEPGDPHSSRFITLMRDALIRKEFAPLAPCTHSEVCPMSGRTNGRTTNSNGENAKWCNFAFDTESAPKNLLKLSEKAGLAKERATLSFVLAKKQDSSKKILEKNQSESENFGQKSPVGKTFIRIASDFIRLPALHKSGYYACSEYGMLLAIDESHVQPKNGELLQIRAPSQFSEIDKKSGAAIVRI